MIRFESVTKRYPDGTVAVDELGLEAQSGKITVFVGPSGCGKTTTLRMIAGLIAPDAGAIRVDGTDVTRLAAHRRNMGYVFQSYALFPHLTVAQNVRFGLDERRTPRDDSVRRLADALASVRLTGFERRRPRELSGGQQQRVALARALVIRPALLLLDESLSNLDAKLRDAMRHEIRAIQRSLGITTLFVTHDQVEALTMCDRIAVMRLGRVVQLGSPEDIYERPATRFVAEFVGTVNVLPATRDEAGRVRVWGVTLPVRSNRPGEIDVLVRPGRIRLAAPSEPMGPDMAALPGRIGRRTFAGDRLELMVEGSGESLMVEMPSGVDAPAEGADVLAHWPAASTRVFPRDPA